MALFALLILGSCSSDDDNNNTSPGVGSIAGTVQVWNDKTTSQTDRSGVTVTIDNLTGRTTTTAADGSFRFDNLNYDTYNLSFSKTGHGTTRVFSVPVNSSAAVTNVPTVQFGALSTTTITGLALVNTTYNGGPGVSYTITFGTTPTSANRAFHRAFLSTSSGVSNTNFTAVGALRSAQSNNVNGGFTADELYAMGFTPGQTVFVKVYGDSYQSNDYEDPTTGKPVFPNLNATSAAAISFVVP